MKPDRETLDRALGILWDYATDAPDAQDAAGLEYVQAARRFVVNGFDALAALRAENARLTAALEEANRLFAYVRPILAEASAGRGSVNGLTFETAVGDACDLIDTREGQFLAASTPAAEAGKP